MVRNFYEQTLTMSNINRKSVICATAFIVASLIASVSWGVIDIQGALGNPGFNPSRTSIVVADAATGRIMADYQPDLALNPASCAKILTSATALSLLGPNYHMSTGFYSDRPPVNGTTGTLYVSGNGDPSLVTEELWRMAQDLHSRGLRSVTGGITVDESFFDSHYYPHKSGNDGRAYTAQTGAVAVNFNSIGVTVGPGNRAGSAGTVELAPPVEGYKIVNKLVTRSKFAVSIAIKEDAEGETIIVTGRVPPGAAPQTFWRSVPDPVAYAGRVIAYVLTQNGISVQGPIRNGRVPSNAHTIAIEPSRSLAELVSDMNKHSNNFMAEQLLKHLGGARRGAPGSTEKGVDVVAEFLASVGIPRGTYDMENGSGLSDRTRISAEQLVKVLVAMYKNHSVRNEFISSLSVLGVDGTMKKWNRVASELSGVVYAKTGTLNNVSTLAGYVPMRDGRMAAFAILANGLPKGVWGAHQAELDVVRSIAEVGP